MRNLRVVPFADTIRNIRDGSDSFIDEFTSSMYAGDFYLLKGAYTREFLQGVARRVFDFGLSCPSSFHKMLDRSEEHTSELQSH